MVQAQGGPARPGPTGAPSVSPPTVLNPRTPPIGGPVVLEPPTTAPPPVPRGAREAIQGQVVTDIAGRRTLTLRSSPSETEGYRRFATITGKLQKGSTLVITGDCFGAEATFLSLSVAFGSSAGPYFLPNPSDASGNFEWQTLGLVSSTWTQTRIEFPVIYNPDPAAQPLMPPNKLALIIHRTNGIYFRAVLTQQDIDTLNAGGTLTSPPNTR